ncbi:MAG: hypothetical protein ACE5KT_00300 [Methanosarcinales archaeon]
MNYDKKMPLRMHAYSALAREKYELPVYAIVVYLIPTGEEKEIESCYHCEFLGQVSHQDFHLIKIWEIDCEKIINKKNIALIPFVPLMQNVDE